MNRVEPVKSKSVLQEIAAHKRQEVDARKIQVPYQTLKANLGNATLPDIHGRFQAALAPSGIQLILEIKPASPSRGVLQTELDLDGILAAYNTHGSAISVLTDQKYFNGNLQLLQQVASSTHLPVLCKDFILDEYQLLEACLAGASAALLIVKMLDETLLKQLFEACIHLGLCPVVEVQDDTELNRALSLSPPVILINNRNLDDLSISNTPTQTLAPKIPPEIIVISASGISSESDIDKLTPYAQRFLIGSSLMQTPPKALPEKLNLFLAAGSSPNS